MTALGRCLVAYHQEYLRALRRPPDGRLRVLVSYCLIAEKQQKEADAARELQAGVVMMQAGYLRRVVEAGQTDMERIMAEVDNPEADRQALLDEAVKIQQATAQAVEMLRQIEVAVAPPCSTFNVD